MGEKHSIQVRIRAFLIWQKLGYIPWKKPQEADKKKRGDFYKGAFDNIPFLNDDAKRTFQQLLLRPGYMIRDYLNGQHERYLAPLTALIIFYAFFALVSSILQPVQREHSLPFNISKIDMEDEVDSLSGKGRLIILNTQQIIQKGYIYLHLDQFPEEVDTQHESSLAALEATLRSQGIPLFLGKFIVLWLAMSIALRRYKMGMSAYAAVTAYILCQFSFFMLFAVILTWGKSTSLGVLLMLLLLMLDYRQLLQLNTRKSLRLAIATGIHYGLVYVGLLLLVSLSAILWAYLKI